MRASLQQNHRRLFLGGGAEAPDSPLAVRHAVIGLLSVERMRLQRPYRSRLCSLQLLCSSNGTTRLSASQTSRRPGWAPTSMRYSANPCLLCLVFCHGAHDCLESGGDRVTASYMRWKPSGSGLCPRMLQHCAAHCNSVQQWSAATGHPWLRSAQRLSAAPFCDRKSHYSAKRLAFRGTAEIHGPLTEHWPVRPIHVRPLLEFSAHERWTGDYCGPCRARAFAPGFRAHMQMGRRSRRMHATV